MYRLVCRILNCHSHKSGIPENKNLDSFFSSFVVLRRTDYRNDRYTLHVSCYILLIVALILSIFSFNITYAQDLSLIEFTKHNLSTSGPGPIKSTNEDRICIFCHTPHSAISYPLWNHTLSEESYILPESEGDPSNPWYYMKSTPDQPDGDSKLCLSCHDGTVAIASIVNLGGAASTISMQGTAAGGVMPQGDSNFGFDLSGYHPVSIEVNQQLIFDKNTQCINNEVNFRICYPQSPIKLLPTDNLYGAGPHTGIGVQCSSCHDAHDNTSAPFLRVSYGGTVWELDTEPLCTKCHVLCSSGCP